MSDFLKLEDRIMEFFRARGYRPIRPVGMDKFSGDWIVRHGNKPINLSELARELIVELDQ